MQNKVYVIVEVPLIEAIFDLYIPETKKVGVVKKLILEMVENISEQSFINDGCKNLYDKSTGEKIDENAFVKLSGIHNGTKLLLY